MLKRTRLLISAQLVWFGWVVVVAAGGCLPDGQPVTPGDSTGSETAGNAGRAGLAGSAAIGGRSGPAGLPAGGAGAAGRAAAGSGAAGSGGRGMAGNAAAGNGGRGAAGASGAAGAPPSTGERGATWKAKDGALYDSCGEKVVLRGINHPTLYVDRQGKALPEIAKTGANAVRLFWYAKMNVKIGEAEAAIAAAIKNGMVPILEMHDSTCKWDLDPIVSYWTSAPAVSLIQKYENQLILNIANETSPPNANEFRTKYSAVIQQMRTAGIHVPLMIDGGNCGRDYNMLLSQGEALVQADPDHNLIFSGHLYDKMTQASYGKLFSDALNKKLTFVVGEFANKTPPGCGGALDYAALISAANDNGAGWLAWSWGDDDPNTDWNSDCGEFDMGSTFSFDSLRSWGKEVAISLPASIQKTAVRPKSLQNGGACQ
jgi:mannan endo-1,4-beta-mannosidase